MSARGSNTEPFFQTLEQQHKFPPQHLHIITGDLNAYTAEETETWLTLKPDPNIPDRQGDVATDNADHLIHAPSPNSMAGITDRPSSSQRGRLFLRLLRNIGHLILNGRFETSHDPPYTLTRGQEATIIDYNDWGW